METTAVDVPPSSSPLKRPSPSDFESNIVSAVMEQEPPAPQINVQLPTSPDSGFSELHSTEINLPNGISRQPSPALSSVSSLTNISSTLTPLVSNGTTQPSNPGQSSSLSGQPPAKRRKLTPAEKQERELEKQRKEREKAELKAKREDERQVKDEERRQKNEERDAKRREKEVERERKEQEKRRIEEEKEKKERAQSRMTAFFVKPPPVPNLSSSADGQTDTDESKTDYKLTFLPFSIGSTAVKAPMSSFDWDEGAMQHAKDAIDRSFSTEVDVLRAPMFEPEPYDTIPRGLSHSTVRDIVKQFSMSESDFGLASNNITKTPLDQLRSIPMKFIFFSQDVRPPYHGTYTKLTPKQLFQAGRNPLAKVRPDTNYSYDSEAEWEEFDEDGEDLNSEGESEPDSADEPDEMDDFLDDEGTDGQNTKRKIISGDLEPVCSGICYEDSRGLPLSSQMHKLELRSYKLELLHDFIQLPIDPFSSSYWAAPKDIKPKAAASDVGGMKPPRQPLQPKPNIFANMQNPAKPSANEDSDKAKRGPTPGLLEGQELEEFKKAVSESEHTKIGLLALLKKQFPKVSNGVLKETLEYVAERQGNTQAEKRWKLKEIL